MSLLTEIQESLLSDGGSLGPTLLKLKFLASRIGSDVLEDWVRHEIEGYPKDVPVPDYRKAGLIYTATISNFRYIRQNAPIPSALIAQHGGEHWLIHELREGMDVIDSTVARAGRNTQYSIDASNLLLLLQDNIYEDQSLMNINGVFDLRAFVRVQSAVRAKMLDLTIRLEKDVPAAKEITVKERVSSLPAAAALAANNAAQSVIYNVSGTFNQITNSGQAGAITVNVAKGDIESLISDLVANGIPKEDAKELADIMKDEKPETPQQPFGNRALKWIGDKLKAAGSTIWGMTVETAQGVLEEAAKNYYDLS